MARTSAARSSDGYRPYTFLPFLVSPYSRIQNSRPQSQERPFPRRRKSRPTNVFIKNTKFRKVLLDRGKSVYAVSGKVLNDSVNTFEK